ncbi:MAG: nucleotidyltransferase family protein [Oscillospiraceae bacterium]|nr:nucleotidyltransferase family protein [Oscillospiraceae bacterium]
MKAIILAGGLGTRLKSVTGEHPKPMADLLGRPLMEHIVQLLRENGFDEICCTLRYRAGEIMAHFGDGGRFGVSMQYRIETKPLGTAGSVGGCRDFIGDDDVLVISGDAACDFALRALMDEHRARGAAVTVALCRSAVPLRYGLAVTDAVGDIRAFIEKPDWPQVVTDLVNTGIYVLSPRVLDLIPAEGAFDFGRDLFPLLLSRGERLAGVTLDGYWCDVGTPQAYYLCCADALEGRLRLTPGEAFRTRQEQPGTDEDEEGCCESCACEDRACLMGALSELMLDMGARFDDGIRLEGRGYRLHISPSAASSAVRIAVQSEDAEFARSLCLSAKQVAEALEHGG